MEDKYTQIKLNVGSLEETSVESVPVEKKAEHVSTPSKFDDPETIPMDIVENRQSVSLAELDAELVSPDSEIFNQAISNANKKPNDSGFATNWHDTVSNSDDHFVASDKFASTSVTDRQFMETFGINGTTGGQRTVGDSKESSKTMDVVQGEEAESLEYNNRLQNAHIKGIYEYAFNSIGRKLVFSLLITVMLFLIENITLFFKNPVGIFDITKYTYLHVLTH